MSKFAVPSTYKSFHCFPLEPKSYALSLCGVTEPLISTELDIVGISGSVTPHSDNAYDLGSSALQWKDLYINGTAYIDALDGGVSVGNAAVIPSISSSVEISGSVTPHSDNAYDLGSSGKQWKDLYVDGTANLDNTDIDGSLTVDGAIDLNATTFDVDASGLATIDSVGLSIDNAGTAANITSTSDADAEDFTISLAGATNSSLKLLSSGTGVDALQIHTTAGSIEIESADNLTAEVADEIILTTTSADGHIAITTAHTAGQAFHLDANANAGSIVDIDAGILDIDSDGATTINAASTVSVIGATSATFGDDTEALIYDGSGNLDLDAVALDIDTSGAITIDAAGAASHIAIVTAHTAGQAFHLDADANAGSIVDIDAGILDIDVTGAATIDAASLVVSSIRDKNVVEPPFANPNLNAVADQSVVPTIILITIPTLSAVACGSVIAPA